MSCIPINGTIPGYAGSFSDNRDVRRLRAIYFELCEELKYGQNGCGSLLIGTGTHYDELVIGNAGEVLTVDLGAPNCLSWQPSAGGGLNMVANVGVGPGLVFRGLTGATIDLRTLESSDGSLSVVTSGDEIDLTVDPGVLVFEDTTFRVLDAVDNSIAVAFDVTGTAATTQTIRTNQSADQTTDIPDTAGATDTFLLEDATQTLTNKTGTDTTNAFRASEIGTTGANVSVATSAPPVMDQALIATGPGAATWQDLPVSDAANVGGATGNVFRDLVAGTINLKTIDSADSSITITDNASTIDLVVDPSTLVFEDTAFEVVDAVDNSIAVAFDVTGTAATTQTIRTNQSADQTTDIPDTAGATDTFVLEDATQTLTNKTGTDTTNAFRASEIGTTGANVTVATSAPPVMDQALIATGPGAATWQDLPVSDAANVGGATGNVFRDLVAGTINLKTIDSADSSIIITDNASTIDLVVDPSTLVFEDTAFEVVDAVDNSIAVAFDVTGTAATTQTIRTNQSADQTTDIPDTAGATDTFVLEDATQTLTNKTGTDTTNAFRASEIGTTGANVTVATSAPPVMDQALIATGPGAATWQDLPVSDAANVGGAAGNVFRDLVAGTINLKTLDSTDSSITITDNASTIDLEVDSSNLNIETIELTSNTTVSTNSAVATIVASMSSTPPSGTYNVTFSAYGFASNNNSVLSYGLYKNGVLVTNSERFDRNGTSRECTLMTRNEITANGADIIDVRFRRSSGTGTVNIVKRSLYLMRVGA